MIGIGKEIIFNQKEIGSFIKDNPQKLNGDTIRSLTIWEECSNHFLIGYFDNYTKAYIQVISKPDDDTEDGENPEIFRLILPVECIIEKDIQTKPLINLELFGEDMNEKEFFEEQKQIINNEIEDLKNKINKKRDLMDDFSMIILNTILNQNINNQDKIDQKYIYIINKETLEENTNLFSEILPIYEDKDIRSYYSIVNDIANIKMETYKIGYIYENMDVDIAFNIDNRNIILTFNIIKDDKKYN